MDVYKVWSSLLEQDCILFGGKSLKRKKKGRGIGKGLFLVVG